MKLELTEAEALAMGAALEVARLAVRPGSLQMRLIEKLLEKLDAKMPDAFNDDPVDFTERTLHNAYINGEDT